MHVNFVFMCRLIFSSILVLATGFITKQLESTTIGATIVQEVNQAPVEPHPRHLAFLCDFHVEFPFQLDMSDEASAPLASLESAYSEYPSMISATAEVDVKQDGGKDDGKRDDEEARD